jgi:antitoxin (DNA-binding transcriptional repressor) of toxin-antitoxin stability system
MKTIDNKTLKLPVSLITALGAGETIALTEQDGLVAFLVPAQSPTSKRLFGLAKGEFCVPADFNDPLPDLEEAIYES